MERGNAIMAIQAPQVQVMPDGMVTDPNLIAQLEAMSGQTQQQYGNVVTDPMLLKELNKNSFDQLIQIESGNRQLDTKGNPIKSKAGAIGAAQVMPQTAPEAAKLAGLEFDPKKYRFDLDYNIKLGQAYFNKQLDNFDGDFFKAAAAYNAGPTAVRNAMIRAEKLGEEWVKYLPKETKNYISKLGYESGKVMEMLPAETQQFIAGSPTDAERQQMLQSTLQTTEGQPESYVFDPNVVKGAAAVGGIAGTALGGIAGRGLVGALQSGIGGAVSGGAGALGAQYYLEGKPQNFQNDIVGLGIELAGGGVPTVIRELGTRASVAGLGKIPLIGNELANVTKFLTGGETEAQWATKRFTIGRPERKGGVATDIFTKGSQDEQRKLITSAGISLPDDLPVEKGLRQVYENSVDILRRSGATFSSSPQFLNVSRQLDDAVNARLLTRQQKRIIEDVLASDKSPVITSQGYASRIDNLIHSPNRIQGLSDFTEEGQKFVRDLLKSNYDSYFLDKTGKPIFSLLKGSEEAAIVAKARDSIPALLDKGFKGTADELESAIKNINKSPGGKEDFKKAVVSYFYALPDKEVVGRFNELAPVFQKTGIMSVPEIAQLRRGVKNAVSVTGKTAGVLGVTLKDGLIGILGAEAERTPTVREMMGEKPSQIRAFGL